MYLVKSHDGSRRLFRFASFVFRYRSSRDDLLLGFHNTDMIWKWLLGSCFASRVPWKHDLYFDTKHTWQNENFLASHLMYLVVLNALFHIKLLNIIIICSPLHTVKLPWYFFVLSRYIILNCPWCKLFGPVICLEANSHHSFKTCWAYQSIFEGVYFKYMNGSLVWTRDCFEFPFGKGRVINQKIFAPRTKLTNNTYWFVHNAYPAWGRHAWWLCLHSDWWVHHCGSSNHQQTSWTLHADHAVFQIQQLRNPWHHFPWWIEAHHNMP